MSSWLLWVGVGSYTVCIYNVYRLSILRYFYVTSVEGGDPVILTGLIWTSAMACGVAAPGFGV